MTIKKFIKKRNNMNIINSSKISLRFASKKRRHSAKKGLGLMNRLEKVNEKIRVLNDNQKKIAAYINNFETRLQGNKEAQMHTENEDQGHGEGDLENGICSMKFIATCLNEIEDGFYCDGIYSTDQEKHLVENRWGFYFWRSYSDGNDILAKNGSEATMEQIAWIASVSTETITRKVCEGLTLDTPFLLFLVPSKEKAAQVRSVCQHIKTKGIHTVNLHSGASLDHQVSGLKSVEPEFIVSTPERLWELVCLKAVDISTASLLVVDGLESLCKNGYLCNVKSIVKSVSNKCCTVVFNDCFSHTSVLAAETLLKRPIRTLLLNDTENSSLEKGN